MVSTNFNGSRVEIYFEGELWRTVSTRLYGSKPRLKAESLEELEDAERKRALNFSVASLAKKAQHSKEIRKKLLDLGVSVENTEYAIARLKELGLLDDADYVERFVDGKKESLSKKALSMKLKQKGIDQENIDKALEDVSEKAAIEKILSKKKAPQSPAERQKLIRSLLSKGFSWDLIQDSLTLVDQ